MATYSKEDISKFVAKLVIACAEYDVKTIENIGSMIPKEELEEIEKTREDSFNILIILYKVFDNAIPDDVEFETEDAKEAIERFRKENQRRSATSDRPTK